jgi:hypothetical protein
MVLPGFTAEASVGPTKQVYRVQNRYGTAGSADVYPQQLDDENGEEDFEAEGLEDDDLEE